ncbi:hypothetical protein Tco_1276074 [Tanacetum coccineum]
MLCSFSSLCHLVVDANSDNVEAGLLALSHLIYLKHVGSRLVSRTDRRQIERAFSDREEQSGRWRLMRLVLSDLTLRVVVVSEGRLDGLDSRWGSHVTIEARGGDTFISK